MTTGVETFIHRFTPPNVPDALTLLLLHGTGGNEDDLLELGHVLDEQAAMLSPRGQVSEHGANRWFRRLAEDVFDTDDLLARTDQLAAFLTNAAEHYQLAACRLVAVGFSNAPTSPPLPPRSTPAPGSSARLTMCGLTPPRA